jgi:hypothetical protein
MPVEKYEQHCFPPHLSATPESQMSMSYTGVPDSGTNSTMDNPDSKYDAAENCRGMAQRTPGGPSHFSSSLDLLKTLLLPMLAIAYLTFCYVVHYHVIPVNMHGIIDVSPHNVGEQLSLHIYQTKPQAHSSIDQSRCNVYQHFDNRIRSLAIARFDSKSQSK